jgi:hypothetical protein
MILIGGHPFALSRSANRLLHGLHDLESGERVEVFGQLIGKYGGVLSRNLQGFDQQLAHGWVELVPMPYKSTQLCGNHIARELFGKAGGEIFSKFVDRRRRVPFAGATLKFAKAALISGSVIRRCLQASLFATAMVAIGPSRARK